ncbi:MAG: CotH kinase family protein [Methylococcales bacterium]|nr:CotH kinase family protein [Methylococcales bacterium]
MNKKITFNKLIIISLWAGSLSVSSANVFLPLPTDITEPTGIYFPFSGVAHRVDVRTAVNPGSCVIDNYVGCTLVDVNADINSKDNFKPEIKVHLSVGSFPNDEKITNATLRQRGNTARNAKQKSYRIKLDSKKNLMRGERKLQLNKHPVDLSRVSNKLSFDLMIDIPHLPSLRTDFANLFIDNVDYGLFTHVENVGKEYLIRRGWDKDSALYKAREFDFTASNSYALNEKFKPANPEAFNKQLEIKRGKDHRKLLEMLEAVNNMDNNFSKDVMDKYFNKNNYLTWLSVNILMGNQDVVYSNFYLLNKKGKNTFYFLPWDYDETWESTNDDLGHADDGLSGFWASLFHQRFFQEPGAMQELYEAVNFVKNNYLTPAKITNKLDAYFPVVQPFVTSSPDINDLPLRGTFSTEKEEYLVDYKNIPSSVEKHYKNFIDSYQYPMGFWIRKAVFASNKLSLEWTPSYDFQGNKITYDIQISTAPEFTASAIVKEIKGVSATKYDNSLSLPANNYYLRIIARDASNPTKHWQISYNDFENNNSSYPGVVRLQSSVVGGDE